MQHGLSPLVEQPGGGARPNPVGGQLARGRRLDRAASRRWAGGGRCGGRASAGAAGEQRGRTKCRRKHTGTGSQPPRRAAPAGVEDHGGMVRAGPSPARV